MTAAISPSRWRHAQECQLRYQERKQSSFVGREEVIEASARRRSEAVHALLAERGHLRDGVVAEVGAGAHGLIWRWPGAATTRVAVDPLAGFYREAFGYLQDGPVVSLAARGEELPLAGSVADLVLSDNVVDHAADPARFVRECGRILKPDGRLYFTVDTHHRLWRWSAMAYNRLHDAGVRLRVPAFPDHPFHLTERDVTALFDAAGLRILWMERDPPPRPRVGRARPYDALKHVFFKNARLQIIAGRA